MASKVYGPGLLKIMNGTIDLDGDTFRCALVDATGAYNADHEFLNEIIPTAGSAPELTAARQAVTVTVQNDTGNDRIEVLGSTLTFTGVTSAQTVNAAIVYRFVTNDTDSEVIEFVDGTNVVTDGNNVTVTFDAQGMFSVSYA